MLEAIDLHQLLDWLEERDADPEVLDYVEHELLAAEPARSLSPDQCGLVLAGVLEQACDPRVAWNRVDALEEAASRLGFDRGELGALLCQNLRITLPRLRGYATLNLPLGASDAEIKVAHRALVRVFHPDRHPGADNELLDAAGRMLARLNEARAILLRPFEEEVLAGEDDLRLGEPWFEEENAPTEDTGDVPVLGE